jgi:hypothetical protein
LSQQQHQEQCSKALAIELANVRLALPRLCRQPTTLGRRAIPAGLPGKSMLYAHFGVSIVK